MPLVDLLARQALGVLHQVDEPEVAGAEDDDVAAAQLVAGLVVARGAPGGLVDRAPHGRVVLVARLDLGHGPARERAAHEVLEPVAVALEEGGALGLAVVREHDDLVGAGRVAPGALDAAELLVELAQGLERVGALEARVVGDLVVGGEGRVDRGAAGHHVGQHAVGPRGRARRRTSPRAAADRRRPGGRAGARRAGSRGSRPSTPGDLPDDEYQGAGDVEAVGVEGAVAGVGPLLGVDPADREDRLVGLARQQVAPARRRRRPGAPPRWRGGARSRRSRPAPSRSSRARSPSRPSGRPGCRGSSRAGCRPGWRRSGRRGRSPTPPGGGCRRRASAPSPGRCRRAWPGAGRAGRDRRSRGTRCRAPRSGRARGLGRDALDDPQVVRVVVVGAEDRSRARCPRPPRSAP